MLLAPFPVYLREILEPKRPPNLDVRRAFIVIPHIFREEVSRQDTRSNLATSRGLPCDNLTTQICQRRYAALKGILSWILERCQASIQRRQTR